MNLLDRILLQFRPALSNEERFNLVHGTDAHRGRASCVNWSVPGHSWYPIRARCECGWSERHCLPWRLAKLNHDSHLADVIAARRSTSSPEAR